MCCTVVRGACGCKSRALHLPLQTLLVPRLSTLHTYTSTEEPIVRWLPHHALVAFLLINLLGRRLLKHRLQPGFGVPQKREDSPQRGMDSQGSEVPVACGCEEQRPHPDPLSCYGFPEGFPLGSGGSCTATEEGQDGLLHICCVGIQQRRWGIGSGPLLGSQRKGLCRSRLRRWPLSCWGLSGIPGSCCGGGGRTGCCKGRWGCQRSS